MTAAKNSKADATALATARGGETGDVAVVSKKDASENIMSKRQRRKQLNEKNRWLVQHPKIQDMDVRARINVKDAGLRPTKAEEQRKSKGGSGSSSIDPALDLMSSEVKFGRLLGGTDQRQRHAAVRKLKAWLQARCDVSNKNGGISELDLLKLWKALWYTLYMADKVPVQDELSKQLASLLWCVAGTEEEDAYAAQAYLEMEDGSVYEDEEEDHGECGDDEDDEDEEDEEEDGADPDVTLEEVENTLDRDDDDTDDDENSDEEDEEEFDGLDSQEIPHCRGAHLASLFVRTFFRTIRREWGNMDKYRLDKFYTLIRMMVHQVYRYMAIRNWNFGIVRLFNDALFEEVLSQTPNGLRFHLIDISLEELAKVNAVESDCPLPLTEATFFDVLEPYLAMSQTGAKDDIVQQRVMERVLERFLDEYSGISDNALEQEKEKETKQHRKYKAKDDTKNTTPILHQVHVGTIAEFIFSLGSDPETNDRYRKSLYDMHKKYMRRLKKIGKDVELEPCQVIEHAEDNKDNDDDAIQGSEEFADMEIEEEADPELESDAKAKEVKKNDNGDVKKKKAKKEKKKRKSSERDDEGEEPVETEQPTSAGKKKSKSKKKHKSNVDEHTPVKAAVKENDLDAEDETIVISLAEQQQAKKGEEKRSSNKKAKMTKTKNDNANSSKKPQSDTGNSSASKRVKWNTSNKAISHKMSMKNLKSATPPKTSLLTPEKGILRKKGEAKHTPTVTSKAGRKRAVDYW